MKITVSKQFLKERCLEIIAAVAAHQIKEDATTIREYIAQYPYRKSFFGEKHWLTEEEAIKALVRKNGWDDDYIYPSHYGSLWTGKAETALAVLEHHIGEFIELTSEDDISLLSVWK